MPDKNDTFAGLMRRIQEGSEDAAWELVQQYGGLVRRTIRRVLHPRFRSKFDSMDFVQLVWLSVFRARGKVAQFSRPEQFAAFLAQMARNKVKYIQRCLSSQKRNVTREVSLETIGERSCGDVPDRRAGPVEVAIARERLHRILEKYPQRYRQIISLRLRGQTYEDIAESLQIAEITVYRVLKRLASEATP